MAAPQARGSTRSRSFRYAPSWCEENIWHLCREAIVEEADRAMVAVVSSPIRACAFWAQRLARQPDLPVVWDYHVVLVRGVSDVWEVWDFDTTLGMPVGAKDYLGATFRPLPPNAGDLAPRFRLFDAEQYRARFSSDRTHMLDESGRWIAPPPPWAPIERAGHPSFLEWTRMLDADAEVLDLESVTSLLLE